MEEGLLPSSGGIRVFRLGGGWAWTQGGLRGLRGGCFYFRKVNRTRGGGRTCLPFAEGALPGPVSFGPDLAGHSDVDGPWN